MTVYRILARCIAHPPAPDWREQLATRLGSRPRRLGRWAELGLYGALECLAGGAQTSLPEHAVLLLSSQHGPAQALHSAMEQAREDLPLPMSFLQTQPSQLLATLSAQLRWCGDARFITHPDPLELLTLALAARHAESVLLGWVNEMPTESSVWLHLQQVPDPGGQWQPASDFAALLTQAHHLRLRPAQLDVLS
jgi:hypothetical protein